MRKLFLMSLFGLSMSVAVGDKAGSIVSLSAPAYADEDSSHNDSSNENIAFSCPQGVSTCYRADGSQYIDVNSLSATAAGQEDENEHGDDDEDNSHVTNVPVTTGSMQNVNPRDFREL